MDKEVKNLLRLMPRVFSQKLPREIIVVKISRRKSCRLNLIYRNKNKPANVLSFRYDKDYGEILVCPEVIRREAKKQGNTYRYQMTWMILHGILHLAGLHHERSLKMAKRVMALEERVLRKLFS